MVVLGLSMVFGETVASGLSMHVSDAADPRFNEFLLEHGWRWIRGEAPRGLFDVPMAWPLENTLAYSEPMLSFGPFYWPLRAMGLSASTSSQLWLMLMAALNFGCFYAFVRKGLGLDRVAASSAAFVFAFGLPRVAQIGHSQLWPQVYVVLIVWGMVVLFSGDSSARAQRLATAAVSAGFVLQAWGCLYNALFLAYACLATGLFALLHPAWRAHALRTLRQTGPFALGCITISLVLVWPLARAYLAVYATAPDWNANALAMLQPRLGSLIYVWEPSWLYGWMKTSTSLGQLPAQNEQALGIGLLTTAVVFYALGRQWRRPVIHLLAFLVIVLWLPTVMWPGERTIWMHVRGFMPGLDALRAISRMGLLLLFPASLALGLFVQRRSESRWPVPMLAIGLLCLVEQGTKVPTYPREPYERLVGEIVEQIDPEAEAFYYVGAANTHASFTRCSGTPPRAQRSSARSRTSSISGSGRMGSIPKASR
jgi:hypothetical protein